MELLAAMAIRKLDWQTMMQMDDNVAVNDMTPPPMKITMKRTLKISCLAMDFWIA